jgi:signal transduction histidine kinase
MFLPHIVSLDMTRTWTYRWLLAAIVVAVLGLLTIQVVLIDMAYRAADTAFVQNVNAALQTVAQRLEARELVTTVLWLSGGDGTSVPPDSLMRRSQVMMAVQDCVPGESSVVPLASGEPGRIVDSLRRVSIATQRIGDAKAGALAERETARLDLVRRTGAHEQHADPRGPAERRYTFQYKTSGDSLLLNVAGNGAANVFAQSGGSGKRTALISRVIDRLSLADLEPIQRRITAPRLDSLLRADLRENGIALDFAFGVVAAGEDTLRLASPGAALPAVLASPYRTALFPADVLAPRSELLVIFPGEQWYLLRQVGPYALATLLFAGLIIAGFIHAFRTIARQERLSGHVRDFINNMVHEFKTPLSTITLAAEAIIRPDVIGQRARIRRYSGVIGEETARMKDQVSKILQMAMVEEGDYELTLVPLDMHALIEHVASVFAVQVESRGGSLTFNADAPDLTVPGDAMHLTNVVHNILENALKYTPGPPAIQIQAGIRGDRLEVRIADNGIGMTAAEAEKAFDKYYRVSTGNLHDVKGFGLGLAYVRLMVHAMNGTVSIEGAPGKGTTVILDLPKQEAA